MRFPLTASGLCLLAVVSSLAQGQAAAPEPVKPKVYALVAAIGDQFSIVSENVNVFSNIEHNHFSRSSRTGPDDILNRLALDGLDKVVARLEPGSKRVYLRFGMPRIDRIASWKREAAVLAMIREQLKEIPGRKEWDKILVATPAYRVFDHEGLAVSGGNMTKLQGFGVFTKPSESYGNRHKEDAISPNNEEVKSDTYIAPFAYVALWVLDPKDLSVIDKQIRYDHQKLADPLSGSLDVNLSVPKEFLASRVRGVIEGSIHAAVMQSKLNDKQGVIAVGTVEAVKLDASKK